MGAAPLRLPQRPRRVKLRLAGFSRILTVPLMLGPPRPAANRCRIRLDRLRGWEETPMLRTRHMLTAAVLATTAATLAACSSTNNPFSTNPFASSTPAPPATPLPPPSLRADEIVGRWGLASYHRDADRPRTEVAARGQCNQPYLIERSASGGVLMLGHDNPATIDMAIKG